MILKCIICFVVGALFGLIITSLTTISSITSYKEEERERFEKAFATQRDIMNANLAKLREQQVEEVELEDLFKGTVFNIRIDPK